MSPFPADCSKSDPFLARPIGFNRLRSNLAGFFLFLAMAARALSMSSTRSAFVGSPLAMADAEVCCEIARGILDLSYHDRMVEEEFCWRNMALGSETPGSETWRRSSSTPK
jgi:hypothetical protein